MAKRYSDPQCKGCARKNPKHRHRCNVWKTPPERGDNHDCYEGQDGEVYADR